MVVDPAVEKDQIDRGTGLEGGSSEADAALAAPRCGSKGSKAGTLHQSQQGVTTRNGPPKCALFSVI